MAFPAFGTRGWNDEVENEVSSAKADAASALANSNNAVSTANAASNTATSKAAEASASASEAAASASAAQAAQSAAEAIGTTHDTIIASRVTDPGSATRTALSAAFAPKTFFYPENYGTIDGTAADDAAMQACVAAALAVSGTIVLGAKTYGLASELQMLGAGSGVTLTGSGQQSSVIKAFSPSARISWGQTPTGPDATGITVFGRPGGVGGGWKFDGNLVATMGVKFGVGCSHATFQNIWVTRCDGDGVHVYTQNCVYESIVSNGNAGHGWVFDYGAMQSEFTGCHGLSNDGWQMESRQSGGYGWGRSAQAQFLRFTGCIVEQGGAPEFANTGAGGFHVKSGVDITFDRCLIYDETSSLADAASLKLDRSLTTGPDSFGYTARIVIRDCNVKDIYVDANDGSGNAQGMGGTNEPLVLEGWNTIASITNGSTGRIYDRAISNSASGSGIDPTYTAEGVGASPALDRAFRAAVVSATPLVIQAASGQTANLLTVLGAAGGSLANIDASGTIGARSGQAEQVVIGNVGSLPGIKFGTDVTIQRTAAGRLYTFGQFLAQPQVASDTALVARGAASQSTDIFQVQDSSLAVLFAVTPSGRPRWTSAANAQTTVGAAGAASALPATPSKYLKVVDSTGATLVIPAYASA